MSIFETVEQTGDVYFSKQPNDIKQLGHIFARDDTLHIIYMGRDPRAVITSKHKASPDQYFCNYRVWSECDQASQRYAGHPRFLPLRYEDLVDRPDALQDLIKAHFDFLDYRHPFSEYQNFAAPSEAASRAMNGLREVNKASLDKWREHLPHLAMQLRLHPELADDLIRLGYESDRDWLVELEGVKPRSYPCRYPERKAYLKEWEKGLRVYLKSRRYLKQRKLL
ncbi:MAG: hypothetical protein AB8B81_01945 [Halioglobus sp.]